MTLQSRTHDLALAIASYLSANPPKAGASAYELAVLNGYVGTQAQYLAQWATTTALKQQLTDPGEAALPNTYADGMSITSVAPGGWSPTTDALTVVTFRAGSDVRIFQTATAKLTGDEWIRSGTGTAGSATWTAWVKQAPLASPTFTGVPKAPTPSTFDSSTQIATTAFVYAATANQYQGVSSGGTRTYQRIATLDGVNGSSGADITLLVSGYGDYGSNLRGTAIVQLSQRGTNPAGLNGRVNWLSSAPALTTFYYRSTGTYTAELWVLGGNYQFAPAVTILDLQNATVKMDSTSTTAPSSLVALPVNADIEAISSTYAPTASPQFTGIPKAPTPGTSDNSTQIATTAWVNTNLNAYAPISAPVFSGNVGVPGGNINVGATNNKYLSLTPLKAEFFNGGIDNGGMTSDGAGGITINTFQAGTLQLQSNGPATVLAAGGQLTLSGASATNPTTADIALGNDGNPRIWSMSIYNRTYGLASANVAFSGSSSTGLVVVTSAGTLGMLQGTNAYLQMPDAYQTTVTTRGPLYVSAAGRIGYNSSLRENKDIQGELVMGDDLLKKWLDLPVYRFLYKEEIVLPEERHLEQVGMIAEDLDDAGEFELLVQRDENPDDPSKGALSGIDYGKIAMFEHVASRRLLERVEALEARLARAGIFA